MTSEHGFNPQELKTLEDMTLAEKLTQRYLHWRIPILCPTFFP